MKLIHTADLHLGARSTAHLSRSAAKARRRELLEVFGRIAELAKKEGAAVLIAGDLFDTASPSRDTVEYVLGTIRASAEVEFFCLPGNHDSHAFPSEDIPSNLTLFGHEWQTATVGDVAIHGISPDGAIPYDAFPGDPTKKNVVLLHGDRRTGGRNAPGAVLLTRLSGKGIDYLALGHYHSFEAGALDERGVYAYAGTPAGRGFDEAFPCGVVMIDTAEAPITPRFIPMGARELHLVEVDVSEAADIRAMEAAIAKATDGIPPEDLVRVELTGALPPEAPQRDTLLLESTLAERFFYLEVRDKTRLLLDPKSYENSISLKGAFIRRVMAAGLPERERDAVIAAGLAALRGEEVEI